MIDFLLFLLGSSGFTVVFILGKIFSDIRNFISDRSSFLEDLIYCPMCLGFWVGFLASLFSEYNSFYAGFSVAICSWIIFNVGVALISISNYLEKDDEVNDE